MGGGRPDVGLSVRAQSRGRGGELGGSESDVAIVATGQEVDGTLVEQSRVPGACGSEPPRERVGVDPRSGAVGELDLAQGGDRVEVDVVDCEPQGTVSNQNGRQFATEGNDDGHRVDAVGIDSQLVRRDESHRVDRPCAHHANATALVMGDDANVAIGHEFVECHVAVLRIGVRRRHPHSTGSRRHLFTGDECRRLVHDSRVQNSRDQHCAPRNLRDVVTVGDRVGWPGYSRTYADSVRVAAVSTAELTVQDLPPDERHSPGVGTHPKRRYVVNIAAGSRSSRDVGKAALVSGTPMAAAGTTAPHRVIATVRRRRLRRRLSVATTSKPILVSRTAAEWS